MDAAKSFSHQWQHIISSVVSPLGFYTLALLIVEAFLIGAGTLFNLPEGQRLVLMWAGIVVFVAIIAIVTFLVIKHPKNLVFTDESHIRYAEIAEFGTDERRLDIRTSSLQVQVQEPQIAPQPERLTIGAVVREIE